MAIESPIGEDGRVNDEWKHLFEFGEEDETDAPLYSSEIPPEFIDGMEAVFIKDVQSIVSAVLCGCWTHQIEAETMTSWWEIEPPPDKYEAKKWQSRVVYDKLVDKS